LNTPDPTHLRLQFHHPPELYPHVHLLQSCPPFSLGYIRFVLESLTVALLAGNNLHAGLDGQKPVPINAAPTELLTPTANRTVHFEHASRVHHPAMSSPSPSSSSLSSSLLNADEPQCMPMATSPCT
jgi:hypothetical protein